MQMTLQETKVVLDALKNDNISVNTYTDDQLEEKLHGLSGLSDKAYFTGFIKLINSCCKEEFNFARYLGAKRNSGRIANVIEMMRKIWESDLERDPVSESTQEIDNLSNLSENKNASKS